MSALQATPLADPAALTAGQGAAVWWLGQAGFLIAQAGLRIVIDAYLSDSLAEKYRGKPFPHTRMMPPPVAPEALTGIDWLLCTHGHTDHMDPGTIPALMAANPQARVLAPRAERARALERGVPADRLVLIDAGETVELGGVRCTATPSAHEEMTRTEAGFLYLGYVLSGGGVTLWHSGDTIPWEGQTEWLAPFQVDLTLLPVNGRDAQRAANGVPGNLTLAEAMALTDAIGARAMIAHHFGLFDFNTLDPVEGQRLIDTLPHRAEVTLAAPFTAFRIAPAKRAALSVLMVCKGNICRSPTAEGCLSALRPDLTIDSAAIMDWNVGRPPHDETQAVALRRGVRLEAQRARQIGPEDFRRFDLILGMDDENMAALAALRPGDATAFVGRLGAYLEPGRAPAIADPWGHDRAVFEAVFDQINAATAALARLIAQTPQDGEGGNGFRDQG
jgi:L-ascorbate metabolism protein UlaG (beta-lactamase superfamily)/protein-tyrosine-phosphatase